MVDGLNMFGLQTIGLETIGMLTIILLGFKIAYNVGHFTYTTFVGKLLGNGIRVKNYGPWAGNKTTLYFKKIIIIV